MTATISGTVIPDKGGGDAELREGLQPADRITAGSGTCAPSRCSSYHLE
ncbi:MAG: hypothetical protein P8Q54_08130 [Akkermansiaceae bacterium]|nr:hypothetical protein [Akkermansiaceae bacterium]MDG1363429.1 hypothetical protein [Akkermansiaceae bacterium]